MLIELKSNVYIHNKRITTDKTISWKQPCTCVDEMDEHVLLVHSPISPSTGLSAPKCLPGKTEPSSRRR